MLRKKTLPSLERLPMSVYIVRIRRPSRHFSCPWSCPNQQDLRKQTIAVGVKCDRAQLLFVSWYHPNAGSGRRASGRRCLRLMEWIRDMMHEHDEGNRSTLGMIKTQKRRMLVYLFLQIHTHHCFHHKKREGPDHPGSIQVCIMSVYSYLQFLSTCNTYPSSNINGHWGHSLNSGKLHSPDIPLGHPILMGQITPMTCA